MKIAIDARLYGLENAGIGRYVMNLVNNLAEIDGKNKYTLILRKKYFNKLKLPENWKKELYETGHYSLREQVTMHKYLNRFDFDLIHFPHFNVPVFYKGKFVVTIHDLLMHRQKGLEATTLSPMKYLVKRTGYKRVFEHASRGASFVIVPSKYVRDDLLSKYDIEESRVRVIYEGVDEKFAKKGGNPRALRMKHKLNKNYFLYVGNVYPHKNIKRAIEATAFINERKEITGGDAIQFVVVASKGVFRKRLEKIIEEKGAGKYVKLLEYVPDNDLAGLMRGTAGFIYPSISEGFGLPGLEAMAAGTLLLASDIVVFKEIYENNANFFNPFDFSSIEKSMWEALNMKADERDKVVERGRKFVSKYSWKKMAEETLGVYRQAGGR